MLATYLQAVKTHPWLPVLQATNAITNRFNLSQPEFVSSRLSDIGRKLLDFQPDMTRSFLLRDNEKAISQNFTYGEKEKIYLAKIVTFAQQIKQAGNELPKEVMENIERASRAQMDPAYFPDLWFCLQSVHLNKENTPPLIDKRLELIYSIFKDFRGKDLSQENPLQKELETQTYDRNSSELVSELLEITVSYEAKESSEEHSHWSAYIRNLELFCNRLETLCDRKIKLHQRQSHLIQTESGEIKRMIVVKFRILPPTVMERLIKLATKNPNINFRHEMFPVSSQTYSQDKFNSIFHIMTPIQDLPWQDLGSQYKSPAWLLFLHDYYHVADFLLHTEEQSYFGKYLMERFQDSRDQNEPIFYQAIEHLFADYEGLHFFKELPRIFLFQLQRIERSVLFLNEGENDIDKFRNNYFAYKEIDIMNVLNFTHSFTLSKKRFGYEPLLKYLEFLERFQTSLETNPPNFKLVNYLMFCKILNILDKRIKMIKFTLTRDFTGFNNWMNSIELYIQAQT